MTGADPPRPALAAVLAALVVAPRDGRCEARLAAAVSRGEVELDRDGVRVGPYRWVLGYWPVDADGGPRRALLPWADDRPEKALAALAALGLVPPHWARPDPARGWLDDLGGSLEIPPSHRDLVSVACLGRAALADIEAAAVDLCGPRVTVDWSMLHARSREYELRYVPAGAPPQHPEAAAVWRAAVAISRVGGRLVSYPDVGAPGRVRVAVASAVDLGCEGPPAERAARLVRDVAAAAACNNGQEGVARVVSRLACEDEPRRSQILAALAEDVPELAAAVAEELRWSRARAEAP